MGDDNKLLYLLSIAVDSIPLSGSRFLLGSVKPDREMLTWLKHQLAVRNDSSQSFVKVLNREFEFTLQILRTNKKVLQYVRDEFAEKAADDAARKKVQSMADEELIALAQAPYADFLDSVIQVVESKIPYERKRTRIEKLTGTLQSEHGGIGVTRMMLMPGSDMLLRLYEMHVRHIAHFNAIMTGIEILLIYAQTGQLPEELPDDLPKDPFTGKPFEYELIDDGFRMICADEVFQRRGMPLLEFKVKK